MRANSDFDSQQWQALKPLLALFPGAGDAVSYVESFKGVVGPETDAVSLDPSAFSRQTVVGLTQPPDPAKLQATLITNDPPLVSEEVAGWHVIAQHRATIDRFKRARNEGTLASSSAYKEATDGLPAQAVASVYVDGTALTEALDRRIKTGTGPIPGFGRVSWLAGAITAEPGGLGVHARLKGDEIEVSDYKAELPAEVPTPVSLFVDEKGLDATLDEIKRSPALTAQLGSVAKLLGSGLLDDVIALFRGEAALYVRPLAKGPEYTLVVKVDDEDRANQVLDRLTTLAGAASQALPEHPRIAGVLATKLTVAKTTLYSASSTERSWSPPSRAGSAASSARARASPTRRAGRARHRRRSFPRRPPASPTRMSSARCRCSRRSPVRSRTTGSPRSATGCSGRRSTARSSPSRDPSPSGSLRGRHG